MNKPQSDWQYFINGAVGYLVGALTFVLFIFLVTQFGVIKGLINQIDESQDLVRLLAVPVLAGLMLAIGGAILGGVGGWAVTRIFRTTRKADLVIGSAIAFAVSTSVLSLVFLLVIGFLGLYNNMASDRIEQYGLIFGLLGLVFGLLTSLLQAFMTVRVRHTWRIILAAILGFSIGGVLLGLIVRFLNPTTGFITYPVLTFILLALGLLLPFTLGGGALGFSYGRLAQRVTRDGVEVETIQPSKWQLIIVAVLGLIITSSLLTTLGQIESFLTIQPANSKSQLPSKTTAVRWSEPINNANSPDPISGQSQVTQDSQGINYEVWCDTDGNVQYQKGTGPVEQIPYPGCTNEPTIAIDSDGLPHVVWYAQEIHDNFGNIRSTSALVESIRFQDGWSDPAIAALTETAVQPEMTNNPSGNLQLAWVDTIENSSNLFNAIQEQYECDEADLSELEKVGLDLITSGDYRPQGAQVPYCRNQYNRLLYTPNPEPQFSDAPPTPNGAFDLISQSADRAQYEVLFATMQWEPNTASPSPGSVLANETAKLYKKVKENPEDYPRGMTLRILLGNYPVVSNFQWGAQIMDVIDDLRLAGVEKMIDPEIGWRLEVANFPGTYPHSHSKFLVVDGKTLIGAGFNFGYLHFDKDHPSGKGYDLLDLGISISGPVAQDGISAYDDLWEGADQIHCEDLDPNDDNWKDTCVELKAISDHVPEVLRYYLPPEGDSNSFSLYRSEAYKEADDFIATSLAASQESVDIMQANFSLEMICMLNLVFPELCTIENALPYMDALLESIENNQTRVRVMMENTNSNGLENRVSGMVFLEELERRGLDDLVELRFYDGKIHTKAILIDKELLIIGSQNLHYSAWGEKGLTEYSISTDDPDAIAEYIALFEYKWQDAIPFEEAEYGSSP